MAWLAMCEREGEARSKARVVSETPPIWERPPPPARSVVGVSIFRANILFDIPSPLSYN